MAQTIAKQNPLLPIIFLDDKGMALEKVDKMLVIGVLKSPILN